jgi:hypothetical protein
MHQLHESVIQQRLQWARKMHTLCHMVNYFRVPVCCRKLNYFMAYASVTCRGHLPVGACIHIYLLKTHSSDMVENVDRCLVRNKMFG